jgi:hypothetical protein
LGTELSELEKVSPTFALLAQKLPSFTVELEEGGNQQFNVIYTG